MFDVQVKENDYKIAPNKYEIKEIKNNKVIPLICREETVKDKAKHKPLNPKCVGQDSISPNYYCPEILN